VPEGTYVIEAAKVRYANASAGVDVRSGAEIEDLVLELPPSSGLTLRVSSALGPVSWIQVVLRDSGSGRRVAGPIRLTPGADGLYEVPGAAEGGWEVLVGSPGLGTVAVPVAVPGPPVDIALPLAARLAVEISDLLGTSVVAELRLFDAGGRVFPSLQGGVGYSEARRIESGRAFLEGLPPGQWTLRAEALDGAVWTGVASTLSGGVTRARLE
jgi:hypothetical protein